MRLIPFVSLLGALGLAGCATEEPESTAPPAPTVSTAQPPQDKRLEQILGEQQAALVDTLVQQYGDQPEKIRHAAQRFQFADTSRSHGWKMTVALYQAIGDTDTATNILRERFRGDGCGHAGWTYTTPCELLGFQPTADDHLERALAKGSLDDEAYGSPMRRVVLSSCGESTNADLKQRLAQQLERTDKWAAIHCYRQAGDEESATRIARDYFVFDSSNYFVREAESQVREWGIAPIPRDWYIKRGDHLRAAIGGDVSREFEEAFNAYQRVGHQEGMEEVLRRAEGKNYFLLASFFAKRLGLEARALQLARQGFQHSGHGNADNFRESLESYGLGAEAPTLLTEHGEELFRQGNYAHALDYFQAADDLEGVQRTLNLLTSAVE